MFKTIGTSCGRILLPRTLIGLLLGAGAGALFALIAGQYSPNIQERYGFVSHHLFDMDYAAEVILFVVPWTAKAGGLIGFIYGLTGAIADVRSKNRRAARTREA